MLKLFKKPLAIVLAGAMLTTSLSSCAAITKSISPEKYAAAAIVKTNAIFNRESLKMPNLNRFMVAPYEQDVTLKILNTSIPGSEAAVGTEVIFNGKADTAAQKMLMGINVKTPGISFDNNLLYLSKDAVALSIPFLYSDKKFVTINPKTFTADYNSSFLSGGAQLPEDFNLETYLDMLLKNNTTDILAQVTTLQTDIKAINATMMASATVSKPVAETLKVGETDVTVDKFVYEISKENVDIAYKAYIEKITTFASDYLAKYGTYMGAAVSAQYTTMIATAKTELEKVTFDSNLMLNLYINQQQLINKVDIAPFTINFPSNEGSQILTVDFSNLYNGTANLHESSQVTFKAVDSNEETFLINANVFNGSTKTLFSQKIDAVMSSTDADDITVNANANWDTAVKEGNNFGASMSLDAQGSTVMFDVNGTLTDTPESTTLSNGELKISSDGMDATLGLEYAVKPTTADALTTDLTDSRSVFDFTDVEIIGLFSALGM